MSLNPMQTYGASLALLALQAAKAAGDALLAQLEATAVTKVPEATDVAVTTFFDHVPAGYQTEVKVLLTPEVLAAKTAVDSGLAARIHTGVAIAQAALDTRVGALQTALASAPAPAIPNNVARA